MSVWSPEQLRDKRIGVLLGGQSAEREVSLKTGTAVLRALKTQGYRACAVDVGWNLPQQLAEQKIEIAFVALHGRYGEDGRVQGLLEMLRIPYTGSGVLASSLTIDKVMTKQLLLYHGIATPAFDFIRPGESPESLETRCRPLPQVVKPSREGSTIGVTLARTAQQLHEGIVSAAALDGTVLVEELIDGAELTVAVVNGRALPVIQIETETGFYDYRAKYQSKSTRYLLPAPLSEERAAQIRQSAVRICRELGCRGCARVDFMLADNTFYCIEVNTIPGLTETSLVPKAARAAGMSFEQLVETMLLDADLDK